MTETAAVTDEDIALRVQSGDSDAFGMLMKRYEAKLLRYATRLLGDADKGEEVVQQAFVQAYRNINSFMPGRRFSPWMYRIAHNQAINEVRRMERSPLHIDLDAFAIFPAEETASADAERAEMRRFIEEHLQKLSAQYREVLVLFYLEELEYREIADVLRIPVSTVGVRLARARAALKKAIGSKYA